MRQVNRILSVQPDSDLAVIPLIFILILAELVVFAAYFFVGAVLGTILLIALVIAGIVAAARFISNNELN
jgi:hypothetical protein